MRSGKRCIRGSRGGVRGLLVVAFVGLSEVGSVPECYNEGVFEDMQYLRSTRRAVA